MKKLILFMVIFFSQKAHAQIADDIERLGTLSSAQFDSVFSLTGKNFPVFPERDISNIDSIWVLNGKVVDYINGLSCGCVFCSAGVLKIKNNKDSFFHIVHLYDYDDSIIGREVSMKVRCLTEKDIKKVNAILNVFDSKGPYLIHVNWRTE